MPGDDRVVEGDYADDDFEKDDLVNVAPPRAPKPNKNSKMARYEKEKSLERKKYMAAERNSTHERSDNGSGMKKSYRNKK
jgi:hypothetical protein